MVLQDTPGTAHPATKRQRTQAFRVQDVTCDPVKSHRAADGHVYFDASSDSDTEPHRQLRNGSSAVASEHQGAGKAAAQADATQTAAASGSAQARVNEVRCLLCACCVLGLCYAVLRCIALCCAALQGEHDMQGWQFMTFTGVHTHRCAVSLRLCQSCRTSAVSILPPFTSL